MADGNGIDSLYYTCPVRLVPVTNAGLRTSRGMNHGGCRQVGRSALSVAASRSYLNGVKLLLRAGALVDALSAEVTSTEVSCAPVNVLVVVVAPTVEVIVVVVVPTVEVIVVVPYPVCVSTVSVKEARALAVLHIDDSSYTGCLILVPRHLFVHLCRASHR